MHTRTRIHTCTHTHVCTRHLCFSFLGVVLFISSPHSPPAFSFLSNTRTHAPPFVHTHADSPPAAPVSSGTGGGGGQQPSRIRPVRAMVGNIQPKGGDTKAEQAAYLKQQLEQAPQVYVSVYKKKPGATFEASNAVTGKNRYQDIIPYDDTRVVLDEIGDCEYINANYVDFTGHASELHHICCQGPTKNTVEDMWSMVWQEKVEVVVMLAQVFEGMPARLKCEHYWLVCVCVMIIMAMLPTYCAPLCYCCAPDATWPA